MFNQPIIDKPIEQVTLQQCDRDAMFSFGWYFPDEMLLSGTQGAVVACSHEVSGGFFFGEGVDVADGGVGVSISFAGTRPAGVAVRLGVNNEGGMEEERLRGG